MTAMSPLQYQKQLRLQEARRRMLTKYLDAATVPFKLTTKALLSSAGKYNRLFGAPPLRDITNLRRLVTGSLEKIRLAASQSFHLPRI